MAGINFADLKLNEEQDIVYIDMFSDVDKTIGVKQYLPIEKKYDLIEITIQESMDSNICNPLKLSVFFDLNMIFSYTDIVFSDEEKEDLFALYDKLETNGIIAAVVKSIPEQEYGILRQLLLDTVSVKQQYSTTMAGVITTLLEGWPIAAEKVSELVDNFDPEKYAEVTNFAKAIGAK